MEKPYRGPVNDRARPSSDPEVRRVRTERVAITTVNRGAINSPREPPRKSRLDPWRGLGRRSRASPAHPIESPDRPFSPSRLSSLIPASPFLPRDETCERVTGNYSRWWSPSRDRRRTRSKCRRRLLRRAGKGKSRDQIERLASPLFLTTAGPASASSCIPARRLFGVTIISAYVDDDDVTIASTSARLTFKGTRLKRGDVSKR